MEELIRTGLQCGAYRDMCEELCNLTATVNRNHGITESGSFCLHLINIPRYSTDVRLAGKVYQCGKR